MWNYCKRYIYLWNRRHKNGNIWTDFPFKQTDEKTVIEADVFKTLNGIIIIDLYSVRWKLFTWINKREPTFLWNENIWENYNINS